MFSFTSQLVIVVMASKWVLVIVLALPAKFLHVLHTDARQALPSGQVMCMLQVSAELRAEHASRQRSVGLCADYYRGSYSVRNVNAARSPCVDCYQLCNNLTATIMCPHYAGPTCCRGWRVSCTVYNNENLKCTSSHGLFL
jgi:hypothetical protein